jgi:hypothetical protein
MRAEGAGDNTIYTWYVLNSSNNTLSTAQIGRPVTSMSKAITTATARLMLQCSRRRLATGSFA